jgi:hypothetical protein
MILAVSFSVLFHIVILWLGAAAARDGYEPGRMDSVFNVPANMFVALMPPGHGIPQLVLPFFFSILFYAAVFALLLWGLACGLRRGRMRSG